jgi:hypothetical protein
MRYYFTFYVDNLLVDGKYSYAQANLFQNVPDKVLKFYELCFNSFLQHSNKECYILVNNKSYFYIKKYTNILDKHLINYDFYFHENYKQVWSLPKLHAYQYVCNIGYPFVFFDLDMIMASDLPDDVLNNEIFVHEWVPRYQIGDWNLDNYFDFIKNNTDSDSNKIINSYLKNINYDVTNFEIPNCAMFGGTNLNKINTYINLATNHCLDPLNKKFWDDNEYLDGNCYSKACILEQLLLGLYGHDFLKSKSKITFLKSVFFEKRKKFPINHIAHDKYFLNRDEINAEILFNILYKVFKKYTVHYTHLLTVPKIELQKFNFSYEEKKVLKIIFERFLKK